MPDWLSFLVTILAGLAAVFGYLVLQRVGEKGLNRDEATLLLREEAERIRRGGEDQARSLRQEIGDSVRSAQDATLSIVRELSQVAINQGRQSGEQLSNSIKSIETRIDAAFDRHAAGFDGARQMLATEAQRLMETLGRSAGEQRALLVEQLDQLSHRMAESQALIEASTAVLKEDLNGAMSQAEAGGERRQQALVEAMQAKLGELLENNSKAATLRDDVANGMQRLGTAMDAALKQLGARQGERLEQIAQALRSLAETHQKEQLALRQSMDASLDAIRQDNASNNEDQKRLKELDAQNARLRRAIADLMLEKTALAEALKDKRPAAP